MVALQSPEVVRVGRVTAVYWPGDGGEAVSHAEYADRADNWPGISAPTQYRIRLVLAPNSRVMDSVTGGRLPEWGIGAAFPGTNTIVLAAGRDARGVLRHELAHLALRNAVRRAPLWFDEGYASLAAGEWNRLEALRVNWAVARGRIPSFSEVNRDLRAGASRAEAGYALATTAMLYLQRLGGERGLEPIVTALAAERHLDLALRQTHQVTLDQFEDLWQKDLKKRYGWLSLITSFSIFWSGVAGLVLVLWARRRRRDRVRKAALDVGWIVDSGEPPAS